LSAQARDTNRSDSVRISVDSVSPSTPTPSQRLKPLTFTLTVTNTTGADLHDVSIVAERDVPIGTPGSQDPQGRLDEALADPTPPSSGLTVTPTKPVKVDLPAGQPVQATFRTTTGIPVEAGLCLCVEAGIYPVFFSAHVVENGVDQLLGVAATYVPSFYSNPAALHVSWVWPLLERPHRLTSETEFTDDLLATSVASGRLSRALAVVEELETQAGPTIPITLLIDPELLDELEVMADAGTPYTVQSADGKAVPGTGQPAAKAWLARLERLLLDHPEVQVQLTPYADPDVESLTARGLTWSAAFPESTNMADRVNAALAGRPIDSTVAWPATGAISSSTLRRLARQGVSTVLLNSSAVTDHSDSAIPPGLARLKGVQGHNVIAGLTSPAIERYVARTVTVDEDGAAALPELIAELAVRVTAQPEVEHALVITAPRYVDPNVDAAVRAITETSRSTFAQPISLRDAVSGQLVSNAPTRLAKVPANATDHPASTLAAASYASDKLRAIASLLDERDAGAAAYEKSLPIAIQRSESSAWREQVNGDAASAYADDLTGFVDNVMSGVHIVRPTSGSYTLASSTSPLPITVENELPYPVYVVIKVHAVRGVPGFAPKDIGRQLVEPSQRHTFNIPTTTEHTGRIQIVVALFTSSGDPLGQSLEMRVHSTALGFIGVVITVVAGAVLGIALLWRLARRVRARRVPEAPPADALPVDQPEPIG
jgi:hypothetical protein